VTLAATRHRADRLRRPTGIGPSRGRPSGRRLHRLHSFAEGLRL